MIPQDLHLKYICVATDHTGYGEAARAYLKGFDRLGVNLNLEQAKFESTGANFFDPEIIKIIDRYRETQYSNYDLGIMHLIPDFYTNFRRVNYKRAGYMYWETSKLVPAWVDVINNNTDLMFACCDYTRQSMLDSGVKVPTYVVPPAFDIDAFNNGTGTIDFGDFNDSYKFYSVFQWTERKNPVGLLLAYLTEFTPDDDVVLILKTYALKASEKEKASLKKKINEVKSLLNLKYHPPILLVGGLLSTKEMISLHKTCDCFTLINRSEGLGIPHIEAAICGNPVITSRHGAVPEFLPDPYTYYVDCFDLPVSGMPPQWGHLYKGDQIWGDPDLSACKAHMRYVYENKDASRETGKNLSNYVSSNFNLEKSASSFLKVMGDVL